jgi:RNA polymerase sigma-70 factor, ECF subfamily
MDQAHLAQLLMRHRTALYAYVLANVRNHADTEDILQNVSLVVVEAFEQLRDEAGFLPWAIEIARRRILKHHRVAGREQALDPELVGRLAEAAGRVEQATPTPVHHAALRSCLDGLPATSRRLMEQRYDGSVRDVAELAARVERSVQSVYAQIKRIKAALRDCVERRLEAEGQA